jgi:hypothetical protein
MSSLDILFVLTQNPHIIEAVKLSKFSRIFKTIVFVQKEMYMNPVFNVPQLIENGSQIMNYLNVNNFLINIQKHETLKEIKKENLFILSIQNFLQKITDVSNNEIVDMVNIHFVHNNICTYFIGCPAHFPQIYFDELKSLSRPLEGKIGDTNDKNRINLIGYDKTLGSLFSELKNLDPENWCREFNNFDRKEQVLNVLNKINFTQIVFNKLIHENTLDLSNVLSDHTHKLLLKDVLINLFDNFKLKSNIIFDYVVGIEGDGVILGCIISEILNIPFVPVKKELSCNGETFEYDSYKVQKNSILMNKNILIVDNIIEDGIVQKNVTNLMKFFFPNLIIFFSFQLNKENIGEIKNNMEEFFNNIILP